MSDPNPPHEATARRSPLAKRLWRRVDGLTNAFMDRHVHRIPPRSVTPYATHVPVLRALALGATITDAVEFGAGLYSTPLLLDRRVFRDLVRLHSYETDPLWAERVREAVGADPRLDLSVVQGPMEVAAWQASLPKRGLILVDDSQTERDRVATIRALSDRGPTAIVVIHDFEVGSYRKAARGFRNVYRVCALNPNVGILWNVPGAVDPLKLRRLESRVRALDHELDPSDHEAAVDALGLGDEREGL